MGVFRAMQRNRHVLICLALLAVPALRADVTLRYETKTTFNPALPPQITEAMMKGMNVALPDMFTHQFRNGKIFYTQGKTNLIVNVAKKEITLLDHAGKRCATVPAAQYGDEVARAMPAVPDQAKALLGSMKAHAESAAGGTATIQGMEGDEHIITITVDAPAGQAALPAGPMVRIVMHVWIAKGSEALRVPALREVAGYNMMSMEAINPLATIEKAFQQLPGLGESLASLTKDLLTSSSGSIMLRTQMEMFMPMLAGLTGQAGGDPNASFMQITQELTQISTEPIADSVFDVPPDYKQATVAEIMQAMLPKVSAPANVNQK